MSDLFPLSPSTPPPLVQARINLARCLRNEAAAEAFVDAQGGEALPVLDDAVRASKEAEAVVVRLELEAMSGKAYGINCTVCGEPICEPQATEHTDDGLAHAECTVAEDRP